MPGPNRISGLNGALPTAYNSAWQTYTDLNSAQIAAFEAFPQDLVSYIRLRRWQQEIAGITLPNGIKLATDQVSQNKIAALKQAIDNGTVQVPASGFPFIAIDGIHMLGAGDVTAVYGYVVRYVQATYAVAASLLAQVNATPQQLTTRSPVDAAFGSILIQ